MVTGLYFRSAVAIAGSVAFPSGPANVINQLQSAIVWGQGSNLMSLPSDCPQRDERKGWMGDSGLTLEEASMNYDMCAFYTYWAHSIRDSQQNTRDSHPAGSVADTNPHTFGQYPSDPAWGTVYPGVLWTMWKQCGDLQIINDHYASLQAYINFMSGSVNSTGIGKLYS
jgi:alpha-L-rhamnosidase